MLLLKQLLCCKLGVGSFTGGTGLYRRVFVGGTISETVIVDAFAALRNISVAAIAAAPTIAVADTPAISAAPAPESAPIPDHPPPITATISAAEIPRPIADKLYAVPSSLE